MSALLSSRFEMRRWLAIAAYGLLIGLTFWTITDRRILLFAVGVLVALMALTLFHRFEPAPSPWNRSADLGEDPDAISNESGVRGAR
jgi:hypothetical protein